MSQTTVTAADVVLRLRDCASDLCRMLCNEPGPSGREPLLEAIDDIDCAIVRLECNLASATVEKRGTADELKSLTPGPTAAY